MQEIAPGTTLPPAHPSEDTLSLLARRRSVPAQALGQPGPTPERLDELLSIAARVPDHRMVNPFRFVVFEGTEREAFGEVLIDVAKENDEVGEKKGAKVAGLLTQAPCMVAVISSVDPKHKTPEWEQVLTAGAVCQNLLIAANAAGFAGQWLTGWAAYDQGVCEALGTKREERVAGFIFLGTSAEEPVERPRPVLSAISRRWSA